MNTSPWSSLNKSAENTMRWTEKGLKWTTHTTNVLRHVSQPLHLQMADSIRFKKVAGTAKLAKANVSNLSTNVTVAKHLLNIPQQSKKVIDLIQTPQPLDKKIYMVAQTLLFKVGYPVIYLTRLFFVSMHRNNLFHLPQKAVFPLNFTVTLLTLAKQVNGWLHNIKDLTTKPKEINLWLQFAKNSISVLLSLIEIILLPLSTSFFLVVITIQLLLNLIIDLYPSNAKRNVFFDTPRLYPV